MTDTLKEAVDWLRNKHEANQYALEYMAQCADHDHPDAEPLYDTAPAKVGEALEFYANPANYYLQVIPQGVSGYRVSTGPAFKDAGDKARAALRALAGEGER